MTLWLDTLAAPVHIMAGSAVVRVKTPPSWSSGTTSRRSSGRLNWCPQFTSMAGPASPARASRSY